MARWGLWAAVLLACSPAGPDHEADAPPAVADRTPSEPPAPTLSFRPARVFLSAMVGSSDTLSVVVQADPHAQVRALAEGPFRVDPELASAAPLGRFTITFTPTASGDTRGTLLFQANSGARTTVALEGVATTPTGAESDLACSGQQDGWRCEESSTCGAFVCASGRCVAKEVVPDGTACTTVCGQASACLAARCDAPAASPLWSSGWQPVKGHAHYDALPDGRFLRSVDDEPLAPATFSLVGREGFVGPEVTPPYWPTWSSAHGDSLLYAGVDMATGERAFGAFDLRTGAKKWLRFAKDVWVAGRDDRLVVLSPAEPERPESVLSVLDGATGTPIWEVRFEPVTNFGASEELVAVQEEGDTASSRRLRILDARSGETLQVVPHPLPITWLRTEGDRVVAVSEVDNPNNVYEYEILTAAGETLWTFRYPPDQIPKSHGFVVLPGVMVMPDGIAISLHDGSVLPGKLPPPWAGEYTVGGDWVFSSVSWQLCALNRRGAKAGWCVDKPGVGTRVFADSTTVVYSARRPGQPYLHLCRRSSEGELLGDVRVPLPPDAGPDGRVVIGATSTLVGSRRWADLNHRIDLYENP